MYKTLLPTICLLACTAIVSGQRIERPPNPSPNGQGTRIDFNALVEEQRARDFVRRMRILRGADSPTNQSQIITLSAEQITWISEIARGVPTSSQVQRPESTRLGLTFGGWDPSQGEFSPLNGLSRDLENLDRGLKEFRLDLPIIDLEALNRPNNVITSPVVPSPPCVADQSLTAVLPASTASRVPVRAQASGLFDPFRDFWRGVRGVPCQRPCLKARELCYKKMKAGFYKDDTACEEGYGACKRTCN